jgi:nitrite reductase (NO-forming)/hydroxylamine reductase
MLTTKFAFRALTAVVALGLIACGGGDADTAADSTDAMTPAPMAAAPAGESDYVAQCGTCHQADGTGMAGAYPPLAGAEIPNMASPNRHIAVILKGMQGPVTVKGTEYNNMMTPFETLLSDEQIAAIATYERTSWGNTGGAVTAAQVAEVRAAHAGRTTPWTYAELTAAIP